MSSTILRCTLIVGIWTSICKPDVRATVWRKSLQKEVLLNSIKYLRGQLFVCLKATHGGRGKRKVTDDWYAELRLEMDIDILTSSEQFLQDRVIECRMKLSGNKPGDPYFGLEQILLSKNDDCRSINANVQRPRSADPVKSADWVVGRTSSRDSTVKPVMYMIAAKVTAPSTTPEVAAATASNVRFTLDGQYVTCDRADVIRNVFQCRDVRLADDLRLPNMDYCPPRYDSDSWRSLEDMPERTRDAVDLLDLCAVIGQQLNVHGYTKHVRVVWGCDKVTPRMRWQRGRWDGLTKDNGYLHDLECTYDKDINWP